VGKREGNDDESQAGTREKDDIIRG